jgi:prepilin-type N-terminal cleavage/methylation domain-containing protein
MKNRTSNHSPQRGFSLVEVLIAVAIFAVIFIAALLLYDSSTGTFKLGMEAADAQQNTRVAFDKLVSDIRMTGFDFDRDGIPTSAIGSTWQPSSAYAVDAVVQPTAQNGFAYRATTAGTSAAAQPVWPTSLGSTVTDGSVTWTTIPGSSQAQQPDEQIEYAGPAAITIRGNFNYEQASAPCTSGMTTPCDNGREPLLEASALGRFPVITTGNDEIVTYAVRSRDTTKNTQSVTFFADVNNGGSPARTAYPGGTAERLVTISNVDLTNANPPYTLYRFHLGPDGAPVASPVAENIRSLNFHYYLDVEGTQPLRDTAGNPCADGSCVFGTGQYDPANPGASTLPRAVRSRIRSVRVQLVGMNEQPDRRYRDQDPIASAQHYRKVRLDSLVVPRNMGKRGFVEQSTSPPGTPTIKSVCFGHCGIAKVEWEAPSSGGNVEQFAVLFDRDQIGGYTYVLQVGTSTVAYVPLPAGSWGQTWYFAVQALNSYGSSTPSQELAGTPKNATQPNAPGPITIEPASPVGLQLTFTAPVANAAGATTCVGTGTPESIIPSQEVIRYRIFRGTTSSFIADASTKIWDETMTADGPTSAPGTYPPVIKFTDKTAANCVQYYYRAFATDLCTDDLALNFAPTPGGISPAQPSSGGTPGMFTPSSPATPAAVAALNIDDQSYSTCNGTTCEVTLDWPKVVQDTNGEPIVVDRYIIEQTQRTQNETIGTTTEPVDGASSTLTAVFEHTVPPVIQFVSGTEEYYYDYSVRAVQCGIEGAPSPVATFPCTFLGTGAINTAPLVTPGSGIIEGVGTSTAPFLFYGTPTVTYSGLDAATTEVSFILFKGGVQVSQQTVTPSGGVASFPVLIDDDLVLYRLMVTFTQGTCRRSRNVYFRGSPAETCLVPHHVQSNLTGNENGSNQLYVALRNICSSPLVLQTTGGLKHRWAKSMFKTGGGGAKNNKITFPKTGGGTVDLNAGGGDFQGDQNHVLDIPTNAAPVPANSGSTYKVMWNFTGQGLLGDGLNPFGSGLNHVCFAFKVNGTGPTITTKIQNEGACP